MLEPNRDRPGKSYQAPQVQAVPADPPAPLLWSALADASSEAAFCSAWLSIQCARISGVTAGLIMLPQRQQPSPSVTACWPPRDLAGLADLSKLATRAYLERRTLHSGPSPDSPVASLLEPMVAVPLGAAGQIIAVAAVKLAASHGCAPEVVGAPHISETGFLNLCQHSFLLQPPRACPSISPERARKTLCVGARADGSDGSGTGDWSSRLG